MGAYDYSIMTHHRTAESAKLLADAEFAKLLADANSKLGKSSGGQEIGKIRSTSNTPS